MSSAIPAPASIPVMILPAGISAPNMNSTPHSAKVDMIIDTDIIGARRSMNGMRDNLLSVAMRPTTAPANMDVSLWQKAV